MFWRRREQPEEPTDAREDPVAPAVPPEPELPTPMTVARPTRQPSGMGLRARPSGFGSRLRSIFVPDAAATDATWDEVEEALIAADVGGTATLELDGGELTIEWRESDGHVYMMDGVSVMDTGNNAAVLNLNTEAIAEVKVLTSSYQAEFGRASGAQITAVTKSGTNRFHGSVYDVMRNSDWDSRSWQAKLNNQPKTVSKESDFGYTIGGPVGKVGGNCVSWCTAYLYVVPANVAGTWRLPQGDLHLEQDFRRLSGTLTENGRRVPIADARLSGERISFTAGMTRYEGRVRGKEMSGTAKGRSAGHWKAVRAS